ncbi:4-phosphoerythronate dehydrogenase [Candidatus Pantoea edessiphila]|uniref:4-phosphoerythronate dehydrogenase n=1 Tax=Candidatus Pantoea edessiphila TaxID=2044610 RepID=UPI00131A0D90|nr:4-phosphoerythronate dehydrogenase [Candidatus Pantoea edessiphila]
MKILVDETIPYVSDIFKNSGNVVKISSRELLGNDLLDADCLIIRSVTKINKQSLVDRKSIKFIGSATSGIDHVDVDWLKKLGVAFSAAPGCNAVAVAEYVFTSLLFLAERNNFQIKDCIIGIVGVGHIGSYLNKILSAWGVVTLLCDPPLSDKIHKKKQNYFYSLNELVNKSDIITFHIPLVYKGKYKTFHIINEKILLSLKKNAILINSSRGAIINNEDLIDVLKIRKDIKLVIDVWNEEENGLSIDLLSKTIIATPHIAGYTIEAKINAIIKLYERWCKLINKPKKIKINKFLIEPTFSNIFLHGRITQSKLSKLANLIFSIYVDDSLLRNTTIMNYYSFNNLQNHHRIRREWFSLKVNCDNYETFNILKNIGFNAFFEQKV